MTRLIEHITNPLEYIECIIAFDPLDWSTDSRHAAIYAIALGWSDEAYTELQNKFNWNDEAVKRLKKFHEEWKRLRKEGRMSEYTKRNEADELREQLNHCHDYIAELEMKCEELTEKLRKSNLAVEHNRHVAEEEALKKDLYYRNGMIAGLKYAIRCNGVSGGEVDQ